MCCIYNNDFMFFKKGYNSNCFAHKVFIFSPEVKICLGGYSHHIAAGILILYLKKKNRYLNSCWASTEPSNRKKKVHQEETIYMLSIISLLLVYYLQCFVFSPLSQLLVREGNQLTTTEWLPGKGREILQMLCCLPWISIFFLNIPFNCAENN